MIGAMGGPCESCQGSDLGLTLNPRLAKSGGNVIDTMGRRALF